MCTMEFLHRKGSVKKRMNFSLGFATFVELKLNIGANLEVACKGDDACGWLDITCDSESTCLVEYWERQFAGSMDCYIPRPVDTCQCVLQSDAVPRWDFECNDS